MQLVADGKSDQEEGWVDSSRSCGCRGEGRGGESKQASKQASNPSSPMQSKVPLCDSLIAAALHPPRLPPKLPPRLAAPSCPHFHASEVCLSAPHPPHLPLRSDPSELRGALLDAIIGSSICAFTSIHSFIVCQVASGSGSGCHAQYHPSIHLLVHSFIHALN